MASVVLCPNCGGSKTVSKPSYIAGDIDTWWSGGTTLYPCPTCDGKGWIDTEADSDFEMAKSIALSIMSTSETLMDECTKRGDRIEELETELGRMLAGEHAADKEIERLRMKIFDIEGREDLVTTELARRARVAEDKLRVVEEMRDEVLEDWETKRYAIAQLELSAKGFIAVVGEKDLRISDLESQRDMRRKAYDEREDELTGIIDDLIAERERDEIDLEMLGEILNIVNPLIKSGNYAQPDAYYQLLSRKMNETCKAVIQFRRKHGIVG